MQRMPPSTSPRGPGASPAIDLERLSELPAAPGILLEIWDVLGNENGSARKLALVLERDTALSARILKLTNSAYFAAPRPVSDILSACVVLGFEMVRSIAIGVASFDGLTRRVGRVLDLDAFWRHSVAVGVASKEIAERAGLGPTGTVFCAGILHDVGKLALAIVALDRTGRVVQRFETSRSATDVRAIEREEIGLDHEQAGRELGRQWRFPPEILAAVSQHHEPWEVPGGDSWGSLIHVGDWTARRLGFASVPHSLAPCPDAPDARALARLSLTPRSLDEVLARTSSEIPSKVERFCESLAR